MHKCCSVDGVSSVVANIGATVHELSTRLDMEVEQLSSALDGDGDGGEKAVGDEVAKESSTSIRLDARRSGGGSRSGFTGSSGCLGEDLSQLTTVTPTSLSVSFPTDAMHLPVSVS